MASLARNLSLPSLAVGLLTGTVLVTACPIAAEDGLEWLDSESDDEEEDEAEIPGGLVADAPDPLQSTNRLLLASEDSSRWVGGVVPPNPFNVPMEIAQGPLFLTDLAINENDSFFWARVWIQDAGVPCAIPPGIIHVIGGQPISGARYFVSSTQQLCKETDSWRIQWSGFVPYY